MRSILAALGFTLFLAACPPPTSPPCPPPPPVPIPVEVKPAPPPMVPDARQRLPFFTAAIHVDLGFTTEEREHIRNAASAWVMFTRGQAKLATVEDLDFTTGSGLEDVHRIVKVSSQGNAQVDSMDARHPGVKVIAFCERPSNPWGARRIYIISDRVDPDAFMWTVAHEMGHLLGLDDLDTRGDVMSGVGRFRGDWFTVEDHRECLVTGACL